MIIALASFFVKKWDKPDAEYPWNLPMPLLNKPKFPPG